MTTDPEKGHYRTLPEGVTPAMVLEEVSLVLLWDRNLPLEYRDTLEKCVRIARALQKQTTPP
jgi:hypothetical protein